MAVEDLVHRRPGGGEGVPSSSAPARFGSGSGSSSYGSSSSASGPANATGPCQRRSRKARSGPIHAPGSSRRPLVHILGRTRVSWEEKGSLRGGVGRDANARARRSFKLVAAAAGRQGGREAGGIRRLNSGLLGGSWAPGLLGLGRMDRSVRAIARHW